MADGDEARGWSRSSQRLVEHVTGHSGEDLPQGWTQPPHSPPTWASSESHHAALGPTGLRATSLQQNEPQFTLAGCLFPLGPRFAPFLTWPEPLFGLPPMRQALVMLISGSPEAPKPLGHHKPKGWEKGRRAELPLPCCSRRAGFSQLGCCCWGRVGAPEALIRHCSPSLSFHCSYQFPSCPHGRGGAGERPGEMSMFCPGTLPCGEGYRVSQGTDPPLPLTFACLPQETALLGPPLPFLS